MSKEVKLEITTNVYDKPYICSGIKDEKANQISYEWEEKRDGEAPCRFNLVCKTLEKSLVLKRMGAISSTLVFEQGKKTKGTFITPYGEMELTIETEYINLPNMFSPKLEFAYRLLENSDMDRNTFGIREIN